jgi:DNA-binding GntR family transcriptional regulator
MPKLPLYAKIKQDLREAIESGELPEGARVPSEMELAAQYGVSRNPTRQALRELELAGYITRTRRRGSFVAPLSGRAPHLRLYQGKVLAIVCPHVRSPHVRGIVEGFIQSAAERGHNAMVYFMECTDKAQTEVLLDIHHSGLGGVALWLAEDIQETLAVLRQFQEREYPFVLYDRFLPELNCD